MAASDGFRSLLIASDLASGRRYLSAEPPFVEVEEEARNAAAAAKLGSRTSRRHGWYASPYVVVPSNGRLCGGGRCCGAAGCSIGHAKKSAW